VAEEKKTQMGTTPGRTQRPTGSPPIAHATGTVPASASGTPAPTTDDAIASSKAKTSYLPAAPDPLLGQTVAERYKIIKRLGEGGMGMVYLALHTVLEKQVALKVLHGEFARKDDLVERFMQEAKAASRIRHENVIDISDFGATPDGVVFFAMELLQGHDLHEEVTRAKLAGNLLPWSRTKKIFLQICSALSAAHARGIIHRDLKPENVYLVDFLGDHDFVKLLDFGIAKVTDMSGAPTDEGARKLTKTGMLFGTPEYMSPEQARGDKVDHRVDIYAMGVILFQLVCNTVPFKAENFMGVLSQHLTEEPPQIAPEVFDKIGAPRALAEVIDKALVKDRDQRYQTIDEFAAAVRAVSGDAPRDDKPTVRAASVPSPAETTRQRPPTGNVEPQRASQPSAASTTSLRSKTQWTGNLTVPEEARTDDRPAQARSKLPLIIGAVVLLGGGIAAAVLALGGKHGQAGQGSAVAVGSGSAAVVTPPPPPPPVEQLPVMATIAFDSKPQGAQVVDATDGTSYGKTPTSFTLPGSKTARRFKFVLKGYGDSVVELVPNREKIEFNQELIKGATKSDVVVTRVPDPTLKPGAGSAATTPPKPDMTVAKPDTQTGSAAVKPDTTVAKPDTQTGSAVAKPDTTVAKPDTQTGSATPPPDTTTKPVKKDDCVDDDLPCLKVDVPGMGSGTK
jgi:serine/threonine-protein kinase